MKERGITLIALVITIIVLLILAGTAIATLTGDNGLITKAMEAREKTEKAKIDEQIRLAQLAAKLRKGGENITVDDLLDELGKQGVDFKKEDDNTIIVDGKYIYELEEDENGDIIPIPGGTVTNPKPKIIAAEIIDKTETSIKLKVTVVRNGKGSLVYSIREENKDYQEVARTIVETNDTEQDEYTFTLSPNKVYTGIKVEAIAENGEIVSKEIVLTNLPILSEKENKNITFTYSVNGEIINETKWTKGPIIVTVKLSAELKGYSLQYTTDNPSIESNWREYPTGGITVRENGEIHVRLKDNTTEETGIKYTKKITNIDYTVPVISNVEVTATSNSITLKATVQEEGSGIQKCEYSKDSGVTWITPDNPTDTTYTFNRLDQNTTYPIQIKVTDNAGNLSEVKSIIKDTTNVPTIEQANIILTPDKTTPTTGNVVVTITNTRGSSYHIQYTKGDPTIESNWLDYTEGTQIVFEQNGSIYARLWDGRNVGAYATANVTNIDKLPPNAFTSDTLIATSTESSITVNTNTTDQKDANGYVGSGNIQYRFKLGTGSYSSYQTSGKYTFNASTGYTLTKNTEYTITVEAKDAVGFTTTGTVTIKTKNTYAVTYNANGGTGAPASQTKIEGTNLILSSTKPTRDSYLFKGWGTSSGVTSASYQPNGIYSIDANVTLFAVWEYDGPKISWVMSRGPVTEYTHSGEKTVMERYIGILTNFPANVTVRYSYKTANDWGGEMDCQFTNMYQNEGEGIRFQKTIYSDDVCETTVKTTAGFSYLIPISGDMMEGDWIKVEVVKVINLNTGLSVPF